MNIGVISCGPTNFGSVQNMVRHLGHNCEVITQPDMLRKSDKIILPGVGSFDAAMLELEKSLIKESLIECVIKLGVPILGICLGMHLFTNSSEEGQKSGLCWVDGKAVSFDDRLVSGDLRVPHIGWNIATVKRDNFLVPVSDEIKRFYFLHSYHVICNQPQDVVATTSYGYDFVSIFQKENIFGTQFNNEKSHK